MNTQHANKRSLAMGLLLAVAPSTALSQEPAKPKLEKQEVEQIVRKYTLDNPEVLLESVRLYQERERAAQRQRSRDAVIACQSELLSDSTSPVLEPANPAADPISVVAFFDYRCGHCKRIDDKLTKLASTHGVRVIYKEFPILGPESILAAKAALAAAKQGAYHKFHQALMTSASITPESIDQIATDLGVDASRLKSDMGSSEIDALIAKNHELAGALQVQATPTFVIGKEIISGALSDEAFQAAIEAARHEAKIAHVPPSGGGHGPPVKKATMARQ